MKIHSKYRTLKTHTKKKSTYYSHFRNKSQPYTQIILYTHIPFFAVKTHRVRVVVCPQSVKFVHLAFICSAPA